MIPLYLMGYIVFKYLGYHTEWIATALSEAVGKNIVLTANDLGVFNMTDGNIPFPQSTMSPVLVTTTTTITRPDPFARFVLYRFLMKYQKYEPEAWLKNVEGLDIAECMKENPANNLNEKEAVNEPRGGGLGGLGGPGGFNPLMFDMMDEEAALKMAL